MDEKERNEFIIKRQWRLNDFFNEQKILYNPLAMVDHIGYRKKLIDRVMLEKLLYAIEIEHKEGPLYEDTV